MSEGKYISRSDELGQIHISEEVLAVIAAAAALEIKGVSGLAGTGGDLAGLLGRKHLGRGVHISVCEDEKICVTISILICHGEIIPDVAKAVQDAVYTAVESASGFPVASVNVQVGGVQFERPEKSRGA